MNKPKLIISFCYGWSSTKCFLLTTKWIHALKSYSYVSYFEIWLVSNLTCFGHFKLISVSFLKKKKKWFLSLESWPYTKLLHYFLKFLFLFLLFIKIIKKNSKVLFWIEMVWTNNPILLIYGGNLMVFFFEDLNKEIY